MKKRLHDVDNVDHQKLEALRKIDKDTYNAVVWLRENKTMFTGTVYEPIMTQVIKCVVLKANYFYFDTFSIYFFEPCFFFNKRL